MRDELITRLIAKHLKHRKIQALSIVAPKGDFLHNEEAFPATFLVGTYLGSSVELTRQYAEQFNRSIAIKYHSKRIEYLGFDMTVV